MDIDFTEIMATTSANTCVTTDEPTPKRRRYATRSGDVSPEATKQFASTTSLYHPDPLHTLNAFRLNKTLCDGIIKSSGGNEFHVHRVILAASSSFFRALFVNNLGSQGDSSNCDHEAPDSESGHSLGTRQVTLQGVASPTLELIIEFAYTGQCRITTANVQDLITAADHLSVLRLVHQCVQFISDHTTVVNCLSVVRFARRYAFFELEKHAWSQALLHYPTVANDNDEFNDLTVEEMENLLTDDALNVDSEYSVFKMIVSWTNADYEERRHHLATLLNTIRFGVSNHRHIAREIWNHDLVAKNPVR